MISRDLLIKKMEKSDRIYRIDRIRSNPILYIVSISKSMAKSKINIDTDFTDYTDFHNNY